jgi:biopolymer transport protein ExbD
MDHFSRKHHNPHAHVIHKPGARLMHHVKLKYVWNKAVGHGARSPNAALNLVSFIDFLVVTVIFLLSSFSASGELSIDKNVKLPKAENVEDVIEAPMVAVNGNQILVDGVQAGSTRAVEELGRLQKIDELFNLLKQKREL